MTMDSGYERLEDQIAWYDRKSLWHQRQFKRLKILSLVTAGMAPLTAIFSPAYVPGALGAIVAIVEGVQQLFQHNRYWLQYRQTCERLRREKFLYMARTGHYSLSDAEAFRLLVENVEALVSDDNVSWMQGRREAEQILQGRKSDEDKEPAPAAP